MPISEHQRIEDEKQSYHHLRKHLSEKEILIDKKFSDKRENLKSLSQIIQEIPEVPFYLQKSSLNIFRFEDVIFNLYPHFAAMRRKGMTTKEIFLKTDP